MATASLHGAFVVPASAEVLLGVRRCTQLFINVGDNEWLDGLNQQARATRA